MVFFYHIWNIYQCGPYKFFTKIQFRGKQIGNEKLLGGQWGRGAGKNIDKNDNFTQT